MQGSLNRSVPTGGSINEVGWGFQPFRFNDLEMVDQTGIEPGPGIGITRATSPSGDRPSAAGRSSLRRRRASTGARSFLWTFADDTRAVGCMPCYASDFSGTVLRRLPSEPVRSRVPRNLKPSRSPCRILRLIRAGRRKERPFNVQPCVRLIAKRGHPRNPVGNHKSRSGQSER